MKQNALVIHVYIYYLTGEQQTYVLINKQSFSS